MTNRKTKQQGSRNLNQKSMISQRRFAPKFLQGGWDAAAYVMVIVFFYGLMSRIFQNGNAF